MNLAAGKAALAESFSQIRAVISVKDAQQLLTLQADLFQPLTMKRVAYGSHVYNIAAETGAEIIKLFTAVVENDLVAVTNGYVNTAAIASRKR